MERHLTCLSPLVLPAPRLLQELRQLPVEARPDAERRAKQRLLGTIRLISELFNKDQVNDRIMLLILSELLGAPDNDPSEENVEVGGVGGWVAWAVGWAAAGLFAKKYKLQSAAVCISIVLGGLPAPSPGSPTQHATFLPPPPQAVCEVLSTAGAQLERHEGRSKARLEAAFRQLERMSNATKAYPSRIRFVMKDVLELRVQHWVARFSSDTWDGQ